MKAVIRSITKGGTPIKDQQGMTVGKVPPGVHLSIDLIEPSTGERYSTGISFFHPSESNLNELKMRLKLLAENIVRQKAVEAKINAEGIGALIGQEIDLGD